MSSDEKTRILPETSAGTSVDLGDDLLDRTAILPPDSDATVLLPSVEALVPTQEQRDLTQFSSLDEGLANAKILMSENFFEEAKRILHKLVREDPDHAEARAVLQELHDRELEILLRPSSDSRAQRASPSRGVDSPDVVLQRLDLDLDLGMVRPSLLHENRAVTEFEEKMKDQLREIHARDAMDIGIGFLEMGLYELANAQFRKALFESELRLSASALLATSLLMDRRGVDALWVLETIIADQDLPEFSKIELYYLMGRAQEQLLKPVLATQWYLKANTLSPGYRDCDERLKKLRNA